MREVFSTGFVSMNEGGQQMLNGFPAEQGRERTFYCPTNDCNWRSVA